MRNINLGDIVDTASGAFKQVDIYKNYVVKQAKYEDDNYLSYTDARDMDEFYDEEDVFQENLVDIYNENRSGSDFCEEDSYEELFIEYDFMNSHKHIPIFVPIIDGNHNSFTMPRAKTYSEIVGKCVDRDKESYKVRDKRIKIGVVRKLAKCGVKRNVSSLNRDLRNLIDLGIVGGLSDNRIIDDLFYFEFFDNFHSLMNDMHIANIGIYKGHLVTFDVGRIFLGEGCSIRKSNSLERVIAKSQWELDKLLRKRFAKEHPERTSMNYLISNF